MSVHVRKCGDEWHIRYPGWTKEEAQWVADRINTGALTTPPAQPDTVRVPREPTIAMQDAFREADEQRFGPHFHDAYRAMLAAAPKEKD